MLGGNIVEDNSFPVYALPDEMITNFNALSPIMEYGILNLHNGRLNVHHDLWCFRLCLDHIG